MKIAIIIIGCLALAGLVVIGIGYMLPVEHRAVREAELKSPPRTVWETITAFKEAPAWRPDIKSVERVQQGSETLWKEVDTHGGSILYRTVESIPQKRLVRQIADKDLPFGGRWTFEIKEAPHGSILRVTEDGAVYSPFYRFMSKFVFGHTATLDKYINALRAKLGETV